MANGDPVLEPLSLATEQVTLEALQEILVQLKAIRKGLQILISLTDATNAPPNLMED